MRICSVAAVILALVSCGTPKPQASVKPLGAVVGIQAPLGLPPVPIPADNPPTADTIALGRILYFDKKLSGDRSIACATCHRPDSGFTDRLPLSLGVGGKFGNRNAPTILNAAYNPVQFWDGRAASLELQAEGPIANEIEMQLPHAKAVIRLNGDPEYKKLFEKAFGPGDVTMEKIRNCIASFERTLISGNSPFDRYQYGGEKDALTPAALRGLELFRNKERTNCVTCHTIDQKFALFTDGKFHNLGVGLDPEGNLKDKGKQNGEFRTPTLRNIALTGPYMHDGSIKTLRLVVDFYVGGGNSNQWLDKDIKQLHLKEGERQDLVAFLESLTGEIPK